MLTATLLLVVLAILALLSLYVVGYFATALQFLFSKVGDPGTAGKPSPGTPASVVVFVPAYNEGEALLDTVETLLHQDYGGPLRIEVLIEDSSDTSFKPLCDRYRLADGKSYKRKNKTLAISLTGRRRKSDKINAALEQVEATYVAFLDADHRADPNWISLSVQTLVAEDADAVQARRGPLDARKLFQFWDSAENHLGNEVLNTVFSRWGVNSFFTGTTCLFKASVFETRRFSESVTEDTYLSYDLLCAGKKIAYCGAAGSYEEVAPEVGTYVARRRRWSSGHNQTFFEHLPKILSAPVSLLRKAQLLMHGAYFLLPSLIVLLINCIGIHTYLQLTSNVRTLVVFLSVCLALGLSQLISNRIADFGVNLLLGFLWVFPQLSIASIYIYKFAGDELYFHLLAFPYARHLLWLHLVLLLFPLSLLLVGSLKFKRPSLGFVLLYLPTFPLALFLDIFSLYLGFVDFILGRSVWGKIRRSNSINPNSLPGAVASILTTNKKVASRYLYFLAVPALLFVAIVVNDLLVFDSNCGHPKYLFFKPVLFKSAPDVVLEIGLEKVAATAPGAFTLRADINVVTDSPAGLRIEYWLVDEDRRKQEVSAQASSFQLEKDVPMGFETVELNVRVRGNGASCDVTKRVSTTFETVQGGRLFLNGEEFPIKGVIPAFQTAMIDLPLREGLLQIKELGANTIRVYHTPTPELLALAKELSLMVVVQPDQTTWANIDMDDSESDDDLVTRYKDHIRDTEGHPFVLIDNLGNELELKSDPVRGPANIKSALHKVRASGAYRFPLSYSTYAIFHDYPVDVMAINMLDTGDTYWRQGLDLLRDQQKAFYASEFGGFVAFFERVEPLIRAKRIREYWNQLAAAGGSGAVFFQSHDNWAQPVADGYNDPFNPEQPDDLRGLWDHKNRKKTVHGVLEDLYADVRLTLEMPDGQVKLRAENVRAFALRDLVIEHEGKVVYEGELEVGAQVSFAPPTWAATAAHVFRVRYSSHRGLQSAYSVTVVDPRYLRAPHFIDDYVVARDLGGDRFEVELYADDQLDFYLPEDWASYEVDGQRFANAGLNSLSLQEPSIVVSTDVQWAETPPQWSEVGQAFEHGGRFYFRFRIPTTVNATHYSLVLEGLGSDRVEFLTPNGTVVEVYAHSYRENRFPMAELQDVVDTEGWIIFRMDRNAVVYVEGHYTPTGVPVMVRMKPPWLEKIHKVSLAKVVTPAP